MVAHSQRSYQQQLPAQYHAGGAAPPARAGWTQGGEGQTVKAHHNTHGNLGYDERQQAGYDVRGQTGNYNYGGNHSYTHAAQQGYGAPPAGAVQYEQRYYDEQYHHPQEHVGYTGQGYFDQGYGQTPHQQFHEQPARPSLQQPALTKVRKQRPQQMEFKDKPKVKERILAEPVSPVTTSWDNPFPVFNPNKKKKGSHSKSASLDKALARLDVNGKPVEQSRSQTSQSQRNESSGQSAPTVPISGQRPQAGSKEPSRTRHNHHEQRQTPPQWQQNTQQLQQLQPSSWALDPGASGMEPPPFSFETESLPPSTVPTVRSNTMPNQIANPTSHRQYPPNSESVWHNAGGPPGLPASHSQPHINARPSTSGVATQRKAVGQPSNPRSHSDDNRRVYPTVAPSLSPTYPVEAYNQRPNISTSFTRAQQQPPDQVDTPNFDAIPAAGMSIEEHVQPTNGLSKPAYQPVTYQAQQGSLASKAAAPRSKSQTDFRQNGGFDFELPGDVPSVPRSAGGYQEVTSPNYHDQPNGHSQRSASDAEQYLHNRRFGPQQPHQNDHAQPNGHALYSAGNADQYPHRSAGGNPYLTSRSLGRSEQYLPHSSSRGPNLAQGGDVGYIQRQPPMQQAPSTQSDAAAMASSMALQGTPPPSPTREQVSDGAHGGPQQEWIAPPIVSRHQTPLDAGYSDPRTKRANPAPLLLHGQQTAPQAAQATPQAAPPAPINPDALPSHPVPVRPGLMGQGALSQGDKPTPVRQYGNAPIVQPQQAVAPLQKTKSSQEQRRSNPITAYDLNLLQQSAKTNPNDLKLQLMLAKKLVEAASVLSDEGGRADVKTRNKNRERYIFDAHKLVKKLVNAGSPDAMFYLADCHGQGLLGLEPDPKEAFNLYQSAAKAGHAQAAYRVAVCCEMGHEEGGGTRRDPLKAMQWYKRAATLGDPPAMYKMGMILLKGLLGQPKNPREALSWLKRAADRADVENPHALHELGLLHESATGNDAIIRDEPYAKQLFTQAANLGYKFSQNRLGQVYEYGLLGTPIHPRQSIAWYTRAAAQGEHQAELSLSGWYLTGAEGILQQSDTEAYLWARKAASAGLAKAEYAMGYFTEVGIGSPANLEDAKRWYWRAASQNFPKARERLEDLKKGGGKMTKSRVSRSAIGKQNEGDCTVM